MKKIFLIPYAGATSFAYFKWKSLLEKNFKPYFVELAGRGTRSDDTFYKDCDEAADDISEFIKSNIEETDEYCIFGHSMGALLAFETYYKLEEKKIKLPYHMFFSGKESPELNYLNKKIYDLNDEKFLNIISLYGAIPKVLYTEEMKNIFLPIFRNDFKIINNYRFKNKNNKIMCDISIFYGDNDFSVKASDIKLWRNHVGKQYHAFSFSGGHFFINDEYPAIIEIINESGKNIT